jgi:hypothetical protein
MVTKWLVAFLSGNNTITRATAMMIQSRWQHLTIPGGDTIVIGTGLTLSALQRVLKARPSPRSQVQRPVITSSAAATT